MSKSKTQPAPNAGTTQAGQGENAKSQLRQDGAVYDEATHQWKQPDQAAPTMNTEDPD